MQPPSSVPSFPFPDMSSLLPQSIGDATSRSPVSSFTGDTPFPPHTAPAGAQNQSSSPSSGPNTLSDWGAVTDSTAPSSSGSQPVASGSQVLKPSSSSLAERRGTATPDLSQSLPTKFTPIGTGSSTPFTPYPSGRPRLKASSSSPGISIEQHEPEVPHSHLSEVISQRAATAATMRWAGVGVAIAPLALPSPEHELTDPFRHYNKSLPPPTPNEIPPSPKRMRASSIASSIGHSPTVARLRDRDFWEGTQEVSPDLLPPIPGSTQPTLADDENAVPRATISALSSPAILSKKSSRSSVGSSRGRPRDYFSLKPPPAPRHPAAPDDSDSGADSGSQSGRSSPSSVYETPQLWETPGPGGLPSAGLRPFTKLPAAAVVGSSLKLPSLPTIFSPEAQEDRAMFERSDSSTSTATASTLTPRADDGPDDSPGTDIHETPHAQPLRQAPFLPRPSLAARAVTQAELFPTIGHPAGDVAGASDDALLVPATFIEPLPVVMHSSSGRSQAGALGTSSEESAFHDKGYLCAPMPPNESARLRALYMHNIMFTGPDMNFERLTHLIKLVFNTKMVMISLIDSKVQWFKSECTCASRCV